MANKKTEYFVVTEPAKGIHPSYVFIVHAPNRGEALKLARKRDKMECDFWGEPHQGRKIASCTKE